MFVAAGISKRRLIALQVFAKLWPPPKFLPQSFREVSVPQKFRLLLRYFPPPTEGKFIRQNPKNLVCAAATVEPLRDDSSVKRGLFPNSLLISCSVTVGIAG